MDPRHQHLAVDDLVTYRGRDYVVGDTNGTMVTLVGRGHDEIVAVSTLSALMGDLEVTGRAFGGSKPNRTLRDVGIARSHAGKIAQIWMDAILLLETGVDAARGETVVSKFEPSVPLKKRVKRLRKYLLRRGIVNRSTRTIYRKRAAYLKEGHIAALADKRMVPHATLYGRARPLLIEKLEEVLAKYHDESDIKRIHILGDVRELVLAEDPSFEFPHESTMRRYLNTMRDAKGWAGSTRQRTTATKQPDPMYGHMSASRPGELVMVDTTMMSCELLDERNLPRRYEMTILLDVFTRYILAFMLCENTSAQNIRRLVARASFPVSLLPGGAEAMRMAEAEILRNPSDNPAELLGPPPFVAIETLVFDNGKPYVAHLTKESLADLNVGIRYCRKGTPEDKSPVERAMRTAEDGVVEYLKGFTGRSVVNRGKNVRAKGLLHRSTADVLMHYWFENVWARRKSKGLKDPFNSELRGTPRKVLTAATVLAPSLPVPIAGEIYVSQLESDYRKILPHGIDHKNMVFDSKELAPFRGESSGDMARGGRYLVKWDPDHSVVLWVMDPKKREWIFCTRKDLADFSRPFASTIRGASSDDEGVVTDSDLATRRLVARFDPLLTEPAKPNSRRRRPHPSQSPNLVALPPLPSGEPPQTEPRTRVRLVTDDDIPGL